MEKWFPSGEGKSLMKRRQTVVAGGQRAQRSWAGTLSVPVAGLQLDLEFGLLLLSNGEEGFA